MINVVILFFAGALVSLQAEFEVQAQITHQNDLDNSLHPNTGFKRIKPNRRRLGDFVAFATQPPENARFVPGTKLTLTCAAFGSPSPAVQWLKNGQLITEFDEVNEIVNAIPSAMGHLVTKMVVTSASNGDEYTCVATSGPETEIASTMIFVEDEDDSNLLNTEGLFRKPSKPIITEYYHNLFRDIGSTAVLPCRYHSTEKAQVYWTDYDGALVNDQPRFRVLPSGDLMISNLRWEDMNDYTCTVQNNFGKDAASTFIYPTKVDDRKNKIHQ